MRGRGEREKSVIRSFWIQNVDFVQKEKKRKKKNKKKTVFPPLFSPEGRGGGTMVFKL